MKEKIILIKNKIIELIIEQKILSALFALIIIMLISITVLSLTQHDSKNIPFLSSIFIKPTTISPSASVTQPKEMISLAGTTINPQKANPTITPSSRPTNITLSQSPTTPTGASSVNQPTTAQSTPGASGQTQPTTPANPTLYPTPVGNPTTVPSSDPQIVFIDSNGQSQTYIPPGTPPVEIIWARYTNQLEHYAIDYPSNWQIVTTQYMGHEAVFIYAPEADPGDPDVQYISYGWSTYFYPPTASYVGSFVLDGVQGTIYTNGSIGSSFIAGVFNYANGFLVLNNNVSDEIFAYIFNHMVLSLDFNTP